MDYSNQPAEQFRILTLEILVLLAMHKNGNFYTLLPSFYRDTLSKTIMRQDHATTFLLIIFCVVVALM